jgi:hypothetical protein
MSILEIAKSSFQYSGGREQLNAIPAMLSRENITVEVVNVSRTGSSLPIIASDSEHLEHRTCLQTGSLSCSDCGLVCLLLPTRARGNEKHLEF